MPDPATQFPGMSAPLNYIPVETQLHFTPIQYANYGPMLQAIENAGQTVLNSPLVNPEVRAQMQANVAKSHAAIQESKVNQSLFSDMLENPADYYGQVGFRGAQGMEITPRGTLGMTALAAGGYGARQYNKQYPPAEPTARRAELVKQPGAGAAGAGTSQSAAPQGEDTDVMKGDAATYITDRTGQVVMPADITYDKGSDSFTFNDRATGKQGSIPADVIRKTPGLGGSSQQPPPANVDTTSTAARSTQPQKQGNFDSTTARNLYNQANPHNPASGVDQDANGNYIVHKAGQPDQVVPKDQFEGGVSSSAPMSQPGSYYASNAQVPGPDQGQTNQAIQQALQRNQFASAGQGVPAGYQPPQPQGGMQMGGMAGAGEAGSAVQQMSPSPQQLQQWQNQNQGGVASADAALRWAKTNRDTGINRAVYMDNGGPGGQPAFAFYGKHGGTNIVPLSQMVKAGFAPEVMSQNTSHSLSASDAVNGMQMGGMAGSGQAGSAVQQMPPGAPPAYNPAPYQQGVAQAAAQPGNLTAQADNQAGVRSDTPSSGQDINRQMRPTKIAPPGPNQPLNVDVTHPAIKYRNDLIQGVQAEANRQQTPVNSLSVAPLADNKTGPTNFTGQDGIKNATQGMMDTNQARTLLWNAIHYGYVDQLPRDTNNGDPIIRTIHTPNGDFKLKADMQQPNMAGEPSGAPYIEVSQNPYHSTRLIAAGDHWMPIDHQTSQEEMAEQVHNITGFPRSVIDQMKPQEQLEVIYSHFRRTNPPNWSAEASGQTDALRQTLLYAQRALDVSNTMSPNDRSIMKDRWNRIINVAGNALPTSQQIEGAHISPQWIALQQAHEQLKNFITKTSNFDHNSADNLLKTIGDPALQNVSYQDNLKRFLADYSQRYAQNINMYRDLGYDVPQLYSNDLRHLSRHGRVMDYAWDPGQLGPSLEGKPPQAQPGFPSPTPSKMIAAPQGFGGADKPWVLTGKSPTEINSMIPNIPDGTHITDPNTGKTYEVRHRS